VVAVDPLAQIDWTGQKPWEAQADFMRRVVGISADGVATIILIAHTIKRPGKAALVQSGPDDVQGCAEFTRLAHTVLLWEGHNDKEAGIWVPGGLPMMIKHNRTLVIGKARFGRAGGQALAFNTRPDGPGYEELGMISPKAKEDK
jgi:hypothetical protein